MLMVYHYYRVGGPLKEVVVSENQGSLWNVPVKRNRIVWSLYYLLPETIKRNVLGHWSSTQGIGGISHVLILCDP